MSPSRAELKAIHPVLMSRDVQASIDFYRTLGFDVVFQDRDVALTYAGVARDDVELHLQWADATQWSASIDRPVYRFLVSDVDAIYRDFQTSGAISQHDSHASKWSSPSATPWGTYEFHLHDPGLNGLQFYQVR